MIHLASDHGAFVEKNKIKTFLETAGYDVNDLGPEEFNKDDDYPDFAFKVGEAVAESAGSDRGILLCTSGIGIAIAANKVKGVRAAYVESEQHAQSARADDDSNVLVLDALTFDPAKDFQIIETWLNTAFSEEERHKRRLNKISEYEQS